MKKLIMWNVISVDGYFEGEKPWDLDFHNYAWGEELNRFGIEQLSSAEAIVYGANTYKGMAAHWSIAKGETAEQMNKIKKYVCSKSLEKADWNNTEILKDAITDITHIKTEGEGNIFLFGSAILSDSLIKAKLIDEFRLLISPVLLGKGRHLFSKGFPEQQLTFLESHPFTTGGVLLRYASN